MSKRGSRNAERFSGKTWKLSKSRTSTLYSCENDPVQRKKDLRRERELRKKERILRQFNSMAKKFGISEDQNKGSDYKYHQNKFCSIKSSSVRTKAIQNVKSFRLYCRKYNEAFSLWNYMGKNFYLVDFKKNSPDVYYFNVLKKKEDRNF